MNKVQYSKAVIGLSLCLALTGCGEFFAQSDDIEFTDVNEAREMLIGIDSNNNGIRDEVERTISKRYAEDITERKVVLKMAEAYQATLLAPTTGTYSKVLDKRMAATYCVMAYTDLDIQKTQRQVNKLTINNNIRRSAHKQYKKMINGTLFQSKDVSLEDCLTL